MIRGRCQPRLVNESFQSSRHSSSSLWISAGVVFDVAAPVDSIVFMRKVIGIFADGSLQVFSSTIAIGHKDFVSSGVAVVEIGVVADFRQDFFFFKNIAGFGIFDFRAGATGFVGFVLRCSVNGANAGTSFASVTSRPTAVVISSFVIFPVAVKPLGHFGRQGVLNLLSLRGVESSADSVAGKVFDKPFTSFDSSRGCQGVVSDLVVIENTANGDCESGH